MNSTTEVTSTLPDRSKFLQLMEKYALTDANAWDAVMPPTKYYTRNHTKKGPGRRNDNGLSASTKAAVELNLAVAGNKLAHRAVRGTMTLKGAK